MRKELENRSFTLLFGPKEFNSMIIDENPTEDAYHYDPHPLIIECSINDEGDPFIFNVTYDDEALQDERKVEKLVEILNFSFTAKYLTTEDNDSFHDVPTFMLSPLSYPEDYTYTCMKCKSEFISFSPRYTETKEAIMCPECFQLHWVNHEDATYRIPDEIKRFSCYVEKMIENVETDLHIFLPEKYLPHQKRITYLIDHSLYAPEPLERCVSKEWIDENDFYRTIEELTIEQLRYFVLENDQGFRAKLLRDVRSVREMDKIKKLVSIGK